MTRIYEVIKHSDENEQKKAEILNILHRIFQSSVHGPKMTHPTEMISENGRIGALFASKAFVQLLVNPLVGKATNQYGYEWPFIFGTGVLLISSFSKLCCFIMIGLKWKTIFELLKNNNKKIMYLFSFCHSHLLSMVIIRKKLARYCFSLHRCSRYGNDC